MHHSLSRLAGISSLVLLLAMALVGPAGASQSDADRLLAAGVGQVFTPMAQAGQRAAQCFSDPTGDVRNLENNEVAIDEPRGDIVQACANHGVTSVTLTATMDQPTDPSTDINWNDSLLGWFIDITGNDEGEFFVEVKLNAAGTAIAATVDDRRGGDVAETICDALYYTYEDGVITVRFGRDCVANPNALSVSAGMIYDQRVESTTGVATIDSAPDAGDFNGPLSRGALLDPGVNRIDGDERIESAVLGSQAAYGDGAAGAVVVARADVAADALSGTPLAIANDAPLLLSAQSTLSDRTAAEIQRVLPAGGMVYLLGGEAALEATVGTDVEALGYTVVRLGGVNRFDTAAVVATDGLDSPATAILADGGGFADAVIAGAASYAIANQPTFAQTTGDVAAVLLTDGTRLPAETSAYMTAAAPVNTVTVGQDATTAFPGATQSFAGANNAETSVMVAETVFTDPAIVGISTEADFADALFGGALVGDPDVGPGPMLLTDPGTLSPEVEQYLQDNAAAIEVTVIFGGTGAITQNVEDAIVAATTP